MSGVDDMFPADEDVTVEKLRATNRRLARQLADKQHKQSEVMEALHQAVEDSFTSVDVPKVKPPSKDRRMKGDETAVMVLSDWQLGKITPTYSSDVVGDRIAAYLKRCDRIIELQRGDHPVRRVVVLFVGDIVEGELIFPGQAHLIDASLFEQVKAATELMAHVVAWCASRFEQVEVHAVWGNHGALGGRSRKDMHPESNADMFAYHAASLLNAGLENVTWTYYSEPTTVVDLGERLRVLLMHGHQVRGWAGIPWYGWVRRVLGWSSLSKIWPDMDFDLVIAGHFHTPVSLYVNGRRVWINASTESHNEYAKTELAAAGEPAQWLLFAKPGQGVTAEYLVSCE